MNASRVHALATTPLAGTWYRALDPRYLGSALGTAHTKSANSRFSAAFGFDVLYLAETATVALFEAQALLGSPWTPGGSVPHPTRSVAVVAVNVQLDAVVDLTNPAQALIVDTNAQELTGDWLGYRNRAWAAGSVASPVGNAPTQDFGFSIYHSPGVKGLLTVSSRVPDQKILVVFPSKLVPGVDLISYTYNDPSSGIGYAARIP
jgi:RES domain-containing protein